MHVLFSDMEHQDEHLCRICATIISGKKYECQKYKDDLENFNFIILLDTDPKYFCASCHTFLFCNLKMKAQECKRFVKRLWQEKCQGPHCDSCAILETLQRGGRPPKKSFLSNYQSQIDNTRIFPTADIYRQSCSVCLRISKSPMQLPCGHHCCRVCLYVDAGRSFVKCAKCCKVSPYSGLSEIDDDRFKYIPSACTNCYLTGKYEDLETHVCGKTEQYQLLSVKDILMKNNELSSQAAMEIAQKWVPHLTESNVFKARTDAGRVSEHI